MKGNKNGTFSGESDAFHTISFQTHRYTDTFHCISDPQIHRCISLHFTYKFISAYTKGRLKFLSHMLNCLLWWDIRTTAPCWTADALPPNWISWPPSPSSSSPLQPSCCCVCALTAAPHARTPEHACCDMEATALAMPSSMTGGGGSGERREPVGGGATAAASAGR